MMGGVEFATDCTTGVRAVRRGRGFRRRPRRQSPGRQRRRQFDGVRRHRRRAMARALTKQRRVTAIPTPMRSTASVDARDAAVRASPALRGDAMRSKRYASGCSRRCGTTRASFATRRDCHARPACWAISPMRSTATACPPRRASRHSTSTWHDWLNLSSLVAVSKVIVRAAQARENSRGAHFRADFPEPGDLDTSRFTRVRGSANGELHVESVPVEFTRVRPGESLI